MGGFCFHFLFFERKLIRLAYSLAMVIILCGHHFMVVFDFSMSFWYGSHGRHSENDDHGHHPVFVHGRPPCIK